MAWRIHEYVLRAEIDNRHRDRVTGRIWLEGVAEPLELDMHGNCQPDLAGCLLEFRNPWPVPLGTRPPASQQKGSAGTITAARKVRVFDVPLAEACLMLGRGEAPPEHMANSIYIEWFSKLSGNVVIESTDYVLSVSAPVWRFSALEIAEQERIAQEAAANDDVSGETEADDEWDEFRCEQMLRESDLIGDKYRRLLEKYADHPEQERLIAHEMGWARLEEAADHESEVSAIEDADGEETVAHSDDVWIDDEFAEAPPDPAREGVDWVRDEDGRIQHPVAKQARDVVYALLDELKAGGDVLARNDDALGEFVGHFMTLHVKLAAALGSFSRGERHPDTSLVIAWLKRALEIHNQTLAAAAPLEGHPHFTASRLAHYRARLFEIREAVLALIAELRSGKE